jgi:sugar phosphate isomerase/epimerase
MIRHPLGLRLDSNRPIRGQIHEAARMGARGVVIEAIGELAPQRLGDTGRRDLRHVLRTVELSLVALSLPTRRGLDTTDQLDERIRRADGAFTLAYELGTSLVLIRAGNVPPEEEPQRRTALTTALAGLGQRADHRGIRLTLETGTEPGKQLKALLESLGIPSLAASIDPSSLLRAGLDPLTAIHDLGSWVAHAYAAGAPGPGSAAPHPGGFGFAPGVLDWEAYLGALEEIGYRGFLTVWPDPAGDPRVQYEAIVSRLGRLS